MGEMVKVMTTRGILNSFLAELSMATQRTLDARLDDLCLKHR